MITGIGCDVVELERIEKVLQRHEKVFLDKVLSSSELETYHKRKAGNSKRGLAFAASRWAAKEAFSKALGTGIRDQVRLTDISVKNNELGAPYLVFSGELKELVQKMGLDCFISLSDTDKVCMAVAVCERKNNG